MKLSYEDHDSISVLTLSGELSADQAGALRRACQERFDAGIRDLVLDIEHLSFLDSAGIEALLWLIDEASQRGGQVRLVNPDQTIAKILEITRLERRFDVHETIESAAKSLR
jgi:anti-sigma B factor antagonist